MISEAFLIELSLQASNLKASEPQDRSHRQGLDLVPFFVKRSSIQSPVFKTSPQTFKYSSAQAFRSSTDSGISKPQEETDQTHQDDHWTILSRHLNHRDLQNPESRAFL
ncbi:hypothetical protein DFH07DRAFT_771829 [Mycena maculata]|uniref:Uncharacterized protein n=1 Tax=Mycena maculata TaxID=230809 RepID=A0AAD7J9V9_9AGAR|nr:hypothetical protein DFH07DRAFT_771829 [Mycena maculata]